MNMWGQRTLIFRAFAAASLISFCTLSQSSIAWGEAASSSIGSVVTAQGKVWAKNKESTQRELHDGSPLFSGDHIVTGPHSLAKAIIGHTAAVLIKADSEADLAQVHPQEWELSLAHGAVLSTVNNPNHRPQLFKVKTRAAVMGVRGTTFFAQVPSSPTEPVFFCPCHGSIELSSAKDSVLVESKHHDSPRSIANPQDSSTQSLAQRFLPAPKDADKTHSDDEIQSLQALLK